jgi:hypothetical protein
MNETPSGREIPAAPIAAVPGRRVSWGAIWAGMFVTVVLQVMFTVLGVACGIASLNPFLNPPSEPTGSSYGALIWLLVSWLVAVWLGARVGGWMSGGPRRSDGSVHGVVVWSFAAAVILLLLTGASGARLGQSRGLARYWNRSTTMTARAPSGSTALAPTGRTPAETENQNQSSQHAAPANTGVNSPGGKGWGPALWTFIALILGLGAAAWGGAMGAASSERSWGPATA